MTLHFYIMVYLYILHNTTDVCVSTTRDQTAGPIGAKFRKHMRIYIYIWELAPAENICPHLYIIHVRSSRDGTICGCSAVRLFGCSAFLVFVTCRFALGYCFAVHINAL